MVLIVEIKRKIRFKKVPIRTAIGVEKRNNHYQYLDLNCQRHRYRRRRLQ